MIPYVNKLLNEVKVCIMPFSVIHKENTSCEIETTSSVKLIRFKFIERMLQNDLFLASETNNFLMRTLALCACDVLKSYTGDSYFKILISNYRFNVLTMRKLLKF